MICCVTRNFTKPIPSSSRPLFLSPPRPLFLLSASPLFLLSTCVSTTRHTLKPWFFQCPALAVFLEPVLFMSDLEFMIFLFWAGAGGKPCYSPWLPECFKPRFSDKKFQKHSSASFRKHHQKSSPPGLRMETRTGRVGESRDVDCCRVWPVLDNFWKHSLHGFPISEIE